MLMTGDRPVGTALVRRPGPRLAEGIVTHVERRPVDAGLAARQHEEYVRVLRGAGWEIVEVAPDDDLPDAPFVEDTLVFAAGLAVLARPGDPRRRPEVAGTARVVAGLGLPIARIEEPGTLDGGDVLQVGETVYVGRTGRTNPDGGCQLDWMLAARGCRVVPVGVTGCLHLKSAITALPDGTLIGSPDLVDARALGPVRVPPEPGGGHVVVLGDKDLMLAASAPRTADLLEREGFAVHRVDIGEFEKLDGCVTCLSVLVPGVSPAASPGG